MTLGNKLQMLRKKKGLSQEQLANRLGVSRQAVSKWELDTTLPETENIILLSDIFRVSTDYLLKENEENISSVPAMVVRESSWDKMTTFLKKYGYYGGYIFSAISLYCFLGYSITLYSAASILYKIGGMETVKSFGDIQSMYRIIIFYIILSLLGIIGGFILAKRLEKKTAIYRQDNSEV